MSGKGRLQATGRRVLAGVTGALAALAFIVLLSVGWAAWTYNGAGPKSPDGKPVVVVLRSGAGVREIAADLTRAHVVRSSAVFSAAAQLTGAARRLKAGEYEFSSGASMSAVLSKIRKGEVVRHFVTVPEGLTSEMVVEILMAQPLLSGAAPVPPEGAILPETYEFQRGEDRGALLGRMMAARDTLLAQLWAQRAPNLPLHSPQEAVTLASIVEKETAHADERRRVAAVFVNRLRQGMRLQSDPTIIYGLTKGYPLGRGIRQSELDGVTPYNTYQVDGLPPGPIANPGKDALLAVMNPPVTSDLYFVADATGNGRSVFSSTLTEHGRNVLALRASERRRPAPPTRVPTEDIGSQLPRFRR